MKRILILLLIVVSLAAGAQPTDSLTVSRLQKDVERLKAELSTVRQKADRDALAHKYFADSLRSAIADLTKQSALLTSQQEVLARNTNTDLSTIKARVDHDVTSLEGGMQWRTWAAIGAIAVLLAVLLLVYRVLHRRIADSTSTIDTIHSAQQHLQEEAVALDTKLAELLDRQLSVAKESAGKPQAKPAAEEAAETAGAADHSLALKVADEIVRIETNLSHMDPSVKGYKQLTKAVERIRQNFMANGYEIVEMLGKPYSEGMKVIANFVSDDSLAEGEQRITGITKPQVNYKGRMIQAAQITVSQNV